MNRLSGGRFEFGVGAGWNREEMRNHSTDVQMLSAPVDPAVLERIGRAGVRRANHWLPSGPRSTVERALDQWQDAIARFIGG